MSDLGFVRVSLLDARAPQSSFVPSYAPTGDTRTGPVAPIPESDAEVFERGVVEGGRQATEAYAQERNALISLLAAVEALQPEPSEELAAMIAVTVERLVTGIVGMLPVDRPWLTQRVERAMTYISAADAARTLWMHPDDLGLIDPSVVPIDVRADGELERGALRIDCSHGWIEDSRSQYLEDLRATLNVTAQS